MNLKKAFQKDERLLKDISEASTKDTCFHIWWLGQSGYLLKWQEKYVLIDPYLSDSLTKKYAQTDKPHIRMTELVVRPEKLDFIDVLTSSHNHTDHLDGDTIIPLRKVNSKIKMIIPEANRAFVANRIQCDPSYPIGLNEKEKVELEEFTFTGVPAAHNELERDENGNCKFMGYVIQFGQFSIYHSGDTLWRTEIIEVLKDYDLDLVLLPINGNRPERRVAGNLDAKEAVKMAQIVNAKMLIPCHYDMFTFNTVEPDEFQSIALKNKQAHKILLNGERYTHQ